jgi:hypothetical protein
MNLYFKPTTLDKQIGWTWAGLSMNDKAYWDTQEEDRKDLHKKKKYDRIQTLNTKKLNL